MFINNINLQNEKATLAELEEYAETAQMALNIRIGQDFSTLYAVALFLSEYPLMDDNSLNVFLKQVNLSNDFIRMGYAGPDGQAIMHDLDGSEYLKDYSGEEFFQKAMAGENAVQNTEADAHSGGLVIRYAVPVFRDGAVAGALIATHASSVFANIVDLNEWSGYGYANIMDRQGEFIIRGGSALIPEGALSLYDLGTFTGSDKNELRAVLVEGEGIYNYTAPDGESMMAIAKPLGGNDWYLLCSLADEYVAAPYEGNARLISSVMLLSLIAFALLVFISIRMIIKSQSELRQQCAENAAVIRQSGKFLLRYDIKTRTIYYLSDSNRQFGVTPVIEDYPDSVLDTGFVMPESREEVREFYAAMRRGVPTGSVNARLRMADGTVRWHRADYVLLPDKEGNLTNSIISFYDNTELREKELAYELRRGELLDLIKNSNYYLEVDLMSGDIKTAHGEPVYDAVAYEGPENNLYRLVEWDVANNIYPGDAEQFKEFFDKNRLISLYAQGVHTDTLEFRTVITGMLEWHRATIQMVQYPDSNVIKLCIVFKNIHGERQETESLKERASYDALTGLLNHAATFAEINDYLLGEGASGTHTLFMIDLDNFKQINDTMGHQLGDKVLADLAASIRSCFREDDIVGRIGGDEFFAFLKNASSIALIEDRASALLNELQYMCAEGGRQVNLSGSVGLAMYHGDISPVKSLKQLYAEADAALYKAKAMGKNRFAFADDLEALTTIDSAMIERGAMSVNLRGLLNNLGGGVEIYRGTPSGALTPMFCNQGLLKLLGGLTEKEFFDIYGQDAFYGVHAEDRDELMAVYGQALRERVPFRHTYRLLGANDAYYYVTVFANFVYFEDGGFDLYAIYSDAEQIMRTRTVLKDRYRFFQEDQRRMAVNALASFRLNLTADRYEGGVGDLPDTLSCSSVDEFFARFRDRMDKPSDLEAFYAMFSRENLLARFRHGEMLHGMNFLCLVKQDRMKWLHINAHIAQNPDTDDIEMLITLFDIDRETRLENMMRRLVSTDYEFLAQVDVTTGRMMLFGGSTESEVEHILGDTEDYDLGLEKALKEVIPESFYDDCLAALRLDRIISELENNDEYVCTFPIKAQDQRPAGYRRWRHCYIDQQRSIVMISRTDVTDTVLSQSDPLTGLLNRQGFYRRVREILQARPDTRFRLHRFDIDNFKLLNETLGYDAGDKLLRDFGAQMRRRANKAGKDVCFARMEADHFVSLRPDQGSPDVESMINEINAWLEAYCIDFPVTAHMGVYRIEDADIEISAMCDRALLALKSIKGDFARRVTFYDDSMRDTLLREQELSADMESALKDGQFTVYFQPQYNYEDGALIGAEALVRWNHPQRGLIAPAEFIPLFERNGFIMQLDEYIWDKSCGYVRKWMDHPEKYVPVPVSVNISRKDIYNPQLISILKAITQKHGVPTAMLKLEITETVYMQDPDQLICVVRALQEEGFVVEMDDFGTGYSSLNTLKDVPVDMLKLDMKFLEHGADNERGGNILASIIRMAHWLKIPIIAEGVETKAQADYLKSLGCVYMQGYHFAPPMPADEFEEQLGRERQGDTDRYAGTDLTGVAAFWDPSTQTELLFNSFVGGAAIMEYQGGNAEILRANDKFYQQLGTARSAYLAKQLHTLARFDSENRAIYEHMLEEAIRTGSETECDVQSLPLNGEPQFWTHNRVKLLAQNGDRYLFYLATENITARKQMEEELRVRTEALQLSVSHMGRAICVYDIVEQILTLPEEYARKHGFNPVLRDEDHLPSNTVIPEDKAQYLDFYRRIKAGEPTASLLLRVADVEGRLGYAWEQLDSVTIFGDDGTPVRAVITCEDVTAQKELEAENVRNNIIIKHTGICVIDYDVPTDVMRFQSGSQGERQLISDYFGRFLQSSESYIHPDYKEFHREQFRRLIESAPKAGHYDYVADNWGIGYRWSRLHYVSMGDDNGRVYRIVGQISDIQKEKDDEALIAKLGQNLQIGVAGYHFNATMAERVFTLLFAAGAGEATISQVLELLGEYYDLSRAYIFEDSADSLYSSNTFEWCAEGVTPEKDNLQAMSYEHDMGGVYHGLFDENGVFLCEEVGSLPHPVRDILGAQNIKSLLQCAVMDAGKFVGFVGFDECRANRQWTDEQIGTLMLVSRIMGTFLIKLRKQEQALFSEDFKAALDNNASFVYIIDPQTHEIVYTNRAIRSTFNHSYEGRVCYQEFIRRSTPCENCPVNLTDDSGQSSHVEVLRPDGMLLLTQALPLHWNGRDLTMITCVDVTELRMLREQLNRMAESKQVLYDAMPCGILQYDLRGQAQSDTTFNRAACHMFGFADEASFAEAILDRTDTRYVHPEDKRMVEEHVEKVTQQGGSAEYEHRFLYPDGRVIWVRAHIQSTESKDGRSLLQAVLYDITDSKDAEAERIGRGE
ncbi:MAG: EAL domain-containing protein [Syntrophomonadaceae bacterium]|nr:EAL domain-containing protein [Syntrophomonadaceae bacterium]